MEQQRHKRLAWTRTNVLNGLDALSPVQSRYGLLRTQSLKVKNREQGPPSPYGRMDLQDAEPTKASNAERERPTHRRLQRGINDQATRRATGPESCMQGGRDQGAA